MRSGRKPKRAAIPRRFVPLSGHQSGAVECESRDRSEDLLGQAFDDGNEDFPNLVP